MGVDPAIEIHGLSVRFPDRAEPALADVTDRVEPGEVVAVTGPSGCGKTTLARTIAGFIPSLLHADVGGSICIAGRDVGSTDPAQLAATVGLVQQDPDAQVCTLRVRQEVAFGPENLCLSRTEIDQRVDEAMAIVEIEHLCERETTTLSGGEKQRLAIASILAMRPGILVLDEPTANLDPAGAQRIFETLARLRTSERMTLFIIEHRLAPLLPLSPRLLVMDRGQIVLRRATRQREDLIQLGLRAQWDRRPASAAARSTGSIRLREVTFGYGDVPVLDRLDATATSGEIVGVIGPNGCGKTTLLRLLAGLESPQEGSILTSGFAQTGMLFQHPHQQIFERTVRREIEIDGPLDDRSLDALLSEARLDGLADAPPLSLSLGEQRRLTVLTTLRTEPDLLLLDEPFIGQDRHNVAWMLGRILGARDRGAAVVLVSHDIQLLASLCDRILYLGERAIEGTPDAVFAELRTVGETAFTPEYWDGGLP